MRKILLFVFSVFVYLTSYSTNPDESNNTLLINTNQFTSSEITMNANYQQFKYQLINLESKEFTDFANLKKRKKKNDNVMLYVAGGLALATVTLILTNNPENYTSNSASSVNLGIAAGGTVTCGLIVAKYFIDKRR